MRKLKSDRSFTDFIRGGKLSALLPLLIIGVLLLLIPSLYNGGGSGESGAPTGEERLYEMCSLVEGVGECKVMITYSEGGDEVYAVAVLCEGAESAAVRARLVELIGSLYGIGSNRIAVLELGENN